MITLRTPLSLSEIGSKDNQEDFIYPGNPKPTDRFFILCDGMGGHERGEVASSTVGLTLAQSLQRCVQESVTLTPQIFNDTCLPAAYDALDRLPHDYGSRKPGTTLTALYLNDDDSFLAAHIGDSRIYQIRPSLYGNPDVGSPIIYRSQDHSLVADLVKAGVITEEEARNHPRRNVITRALQPGLDERFDASTLYSADIQSGDFFFLCSDGILERVTDADLCRIICDTDTTDEEKLSRISSLCALGTRDNYSCWLIPVDKVTHPSHRSPYRAPLMALGAIIAVALGGIVTYYGGWLKPNPAPVACAPDTAAFTPDTSVIDTLILQEPLPPEETDVRPDTTPAGPLRQTIPPVHEEKSEPAKAVRDTAPVQTPPSTHPGSVPPPPKKTDSKTVPPKPNRTTPGSTQVPKPPKK